MQTEYLRGHVFRPAHPRLANTSITTCMSRWRRLLSILFPSAHTVSNLSFDLYPPSIQSHTRITFLSLSLLSYSLALQLLHQNATFYRSQHLVQDPPPARVALALTTRGIHRCVPYSSRVCTTRRVVRIFQIFPFVSASLSLSVFVFSQK